MVLQDDIPLRVCNRTYALVNIISSNELYLLTAVIESLLITPSEDIRTRRKLHTGDDSEALHL